MIRTNQILIKRLRVTVTAGANTRQAFPHGLSTTPGTSHVECFATGADDDVATPVACFVKTDATNVTIKCSVNNTVVIISIWRNRDDVGRPANVA